MQEGKITTNIKFNIDFTLPELSVTKIVMWDFHVDDFDKIRYNMILGRDILTELGLNLKTYDHVIEAYDVLFKWTTAPMVDLGMYEFKHLETRKITPE